MSHPMYECREYNRGRQECAGCDHIGPHARHLDCGRVFGSCPKCVPVSSESPGDENTMVTTASLNIPTTGQFVMVWEYEGSIWGHTCRWHNTAGLQHYNASTDEWVRQPVQELLQTGNAYIVLLGGGDE